MLARQSIYKCDGCGVETDDLCWWTRCATSTSSNVGITYDIAINPKDFCRDCWRKMLNVLSRPSAIPQAGSGPATKSATRDET